MDLHDFFADLRARKSFEVLGDLEIGCFSACQLEVGEAPSLRRSEMPLAWRHVLGLPPEPAA